MKICTTCKKTKPIEAYAIRNDGKAGTRPRLQCRECMNSKSRNRPNYGQWHRNNNERVKNHNRKASLKRYYGITIEDYNKMLKEQVGICKICHTKEEENTKGVLCVDHCHKTGKIRGLLCSTCNAGLGAFKDNIQLLDNAKQYLQESVNG